MSTQHLHKPSPIEVWLSQQNLKVTCRVVAEDESTEEFTVESLSMRGAQREMTGYFINQGYEPVGRWEYEPIGDGTQDLDGIAETSRKFKLARP